MKCVQKKGKKGNCVQESTPADHEENESNGGKTKKNGRKKRVAIKWQE